MLATNRPGDGSHHARTSSMASETLQLREIAVTDLARLDALYAASTPGEWYRLGRAIHQDGDGLAMLERIARFDGENGEAKAELIAALHNAWPMLRDKLRELSEERDRHKAGEADMRRFHDACIRDLYTMLGVDASDGEIRYKWASLAVSSIKRKLAAAESRLAEMEGEPSEDALDSVRGFMQAIRNIQGCTFAQARRWCLERGDDVSAWPDIEGYVTEQAAALTIYRVISAARAAREQGNG